MLRNTSKEYESEVAKIKFESNKEINREIEKTAKDVFLGVFSRWISETKMQKRWLWPIQGYCLAAGLLLLMLARIYIYPIF